MCERLPQLLREIRLVLGLDLSVSAAFGVLAVCLCLAVKRLPEKCRPKFQSLASICLFLPFCFLAVRWQSSLMVIAALVLGFFWILKGWDHVTRSLQELAAALLHRVGVDRERAMNMAGVVLSPPSSPVPTSSVDGPKGIEMKTWDQVLSPIQPKDIPTPVLENIVWLVGPFGAKDKEKPVGEISLQTVQERFLRWLDECGGEANGFRIAREFFPLAARETGEQLTRENFDRWREPLRQLGLIHIRLAPDGNVAVLMDRGRAYLTTRGRKT